MASDSLDRSLAAVLAETHTSPHGPHPDLDQLSDLLHDALPPAEAESVRDHLESCRECTKTLLDLEMLSGEQPDGESEDSLATPAGASDFATAAAYRRFLASVAADPPAAADRAAAADVPGTADPQGTQHTASGRGRWLGAVAALATAASLVLAMRVVQLESTVDRLEAPSSEVPILYLQDTRADDSAALLELGSAERFVIVMPLAEPDGFPSYRVEVLDSAARVLWQADGLEPSELGALRLGFSRRSLPPGVYRLRFFGQGSLEPLAEFPLDVR